MFKHVCIVWGVGLVLVTFGLAVKSAPSVPSIAPVAQQTELSRERLINRVTQPYKRMVYMCDSLAQYSYLVPQAQLPIKCAELRVNGNLAIERMQTMKDLNLLSRQVDQFEITIASPLQDMEATYATVRRLMK